MVESFSFVEPRVFSPPRENAVARRVSGNSEFRAPIIVILADLYLSFPFVKWGTLWKIGDNPRLSKTVRRVGFYADWRVMLGDDDDCHSLLRVHDSLLSRVRAYTVRVSDMWVRVHPRAIFFALFPPAFLPNSRAYSYVCTCRRLHGCHGCATCVRRDLYMSPERI